MLDRQIALAAAHAQMPSKFGPPPSSTGAVAVTDEMDLAKVLAQQRDDVDRLAHMRRWRLAPPLSWRGHRRAGHRSRPWVIGDAIFAGCQPQQGRAPAGAPAGIEQLL